VKFMFICIFSDCVISIKFVHVHRQLLLKPYGNVSSSLSLEFESSNRSKFSENVAL